ncbi:MAG: hypothetical protein R2796_04230 [Chitinophagaceae bacterium]
MKKILILFIFLAQNLFSLAQSNESLVISQPFYVPTIETIEHPIGDSKIKVKIYQYGEPNHILCINLHANETTSVNAATAVLANTGGTIVRVMNNEQRVIPFKINGVRYRFDPNRIFSDVGIQQTLRENGRISAAAIKAVDQFAKSLLAYFPDSISCIVALHNNTNEAYSVKSYLPGSRREKDAKAVAPFASQDVDDIAFTTDSLLYKKMADCGYNSIWQDNINVKQDGSLSVYCGNNNIRYINIETQHGSVSQYATMFESLLAILFEDMKKD